MSLLFLNPAMPIPALSPLLTGLQAGQVDLAALSPVVGELRQRLTESGFGGLNPAEREHVRSAVEGMEQALSRFDDGTGRVSAEALQPYVNSVVRAWPIRLNYWAGGADDVSSQYSILEEIGSGGLSRVFFANDNETGEMVAIKMAEAPADAEQQGITQQTVEDALRREYELLSSLRPGSGPRVLRLGTMQGKACMVMQLLQGKDLFSARDEFHHGLENDADLARLIGTCTEVVRSVAALHAQGIVHCDVKPENFMYRDGRVQAFDFGIAMRNRETRAMIVGTPDYMSPESFLPGLPATFQRDVFALGATMYWMLTGHTPYESGSIQETVKKLIDPNFAPEPPSAVLLRNRPDLAERLSPDLLQALDAIVMQAISREESARYPTGAFMLVELRRLANRFALTSAPSVRTAFRRS